MTTPASAASQPQASALGANRNFILRGLPLAIALAGFMSFGNVNIGAIGQGLGYALAGVMVFMTFRVLGFVDLTVDGAFPIGGATCAGSIEIVRPLEDFTPKTYRIGS